MFERCLYFNLNALTRAVNRIWDDAFASFELSPAHAYLLRTVLQQPGLSPKQLAQELKLEKSTITRFLTALEKRELIIRQRAASGDAREQAIHPTTQAKALAKELEKKGEALYQSMLQQVGSDELQQLVSQLRKIEQGLR